MGSDFSEPALYRFCWNTSRKLESRNRCNHNFALTNDPTDYTGFDNIQFCGSNDSWSTQEYGTIVKKFHNSWFALRRIFLATMTRVPPQQRDPTLKPAVM